jgi:hypothetical protein
MGNRLCSAPQNEMARVMRTTYVDQSFDFRNFEMFCWIWMMRCI